MSKAKQAVRERFRNLVFERDGHRCRVCKKHKKELKADQHMDAHHITNRNQMPNGGYVPENGITLCPFCHVIAEMCMEIDMIPYPDYWPSKLYRDINSSKEKAYEASLGL